MAFNVKRNDARSFIDETIRTNHIVIFYKTGCNDTAKVKTVLQLFNKTSFDVAIDTLPNGDVIRAELASKVNRSTLPLVFVKKICLPRIDEAALKFHLLTNDNVVGGVGSEQPTLNSFYEYDLIVIGGGSGGIAAAKEVAKLGRKVVLFDFVHPTPLGTTWGLGGTGVNAGALATKSLHHSALYGEAINDGYGYGWTFSGSSGPPSISINWDRIREDVQNKLVKFTNAEYEKQLEDLGVLYVNAEAKFVDAHTVLAEVTDKQSGVKKDVKYSANYIIIATGIRPRYPKIPGAREYCVTSDDLYTCPYVPGKTLVVGGSFVATAVAGVLRGWGLDVTLMARNHLLSDFDQEMVDRIMTHIVERGTTFIKGAECLRVEQIKPGTPGLLRVVWRFTKGDEAEKEQISEFNTVLWAIGREPSTLKYLGLDKIGVKINEITGKIITNIYEQTNIPNIYAVGDVLDGKPELSTAAIPCAQRLIRRLFAGSKKLMNYDVIPRAIYTPVEYGFCGLTEEFAKQRHGERNIEVFHRTFRPFEWKVSRGETSGVTCYVKIVCLKPMNYRVVGVHILGPNAGEIVNGLGVAIRAGAVKDDFDDTIGIQCSNAEQYIGLEASKTNGQPFGMKWSY